jgi:hypothetical protein
MASGLGAVCAVLAHTRGTARLRDLINLVEAVSAVGGKRVGEYCTNRDKLADVHAIRLASIQEGCCASWRRKERPKQKESGPIASRSRS